MYNKPMLRDDALKGKTILVTGGGTGLGKSMSKYFLELSFQAFIQDSFQDLLGDPPELDFRLILRPQSLHYTHFRGHWNVQLFLFNIRIGPNKLTSFNRCV